MDISKFKVPVEKLKWDCDPMYAVNTIDEGIGILTDMEAGEQGEDGTYPEGSLNFIVNRKLTEMAEKMKKFQMRDKKASGNNSE
jgi:hypothetical protein